MEFINRARKELAAWEAPRLLADAKKRAVADDMSEWPLARETLNKLIQRYEAVGHDAAREAKDILSWMNALEAALNELKRGGSPDNEGEKQMMAALRVEQDAKPIDEIRLAWKQVRDWGYKDQVTGEPRFVDTPKYRPYVLAAEAKLQALTRAR